MAVSVGETRAASPCTLCVCRSSGAQCQTLKVDCFQLRSRVALEDILRDSVCRAQCGNILDPGRPSSQGRPASSTFQPIQPGFNNNFRDQTDQQQQSQQSRPSVGLAPTGFADGLVPPPPPPPSSQSNVRSRGRPSSSIPFRPPPISSQGRFPFPIPPFLRSLFNR